MVVDATPVQLKCKNDVLALTDTFPTTPHPAEIAPAFAAIRVTMGVPIMTALPAFPEINPFTSQAAVSVLFDIFLEENKIKEFNIQQEIEFRMIQEDQEEGKQRYKDLLNQIESLKKMDVNSYVYNLEK